MCSDLNELENNSTFYKNTSFTEALWQKKNYSNTIKQVYYLPITYFLNIDLKFRLTSSFTSNGNDPCAMTTKLFKDYIFRFYRKCT